MNGDVVVVESTGEVVEAPESTEAEPIVAEVVEEQKPRKRIVKKVKEPDAIESFFGGAE